MIVKLTQSYIDTSLDCPPDKRRVEVCDSVVKGMYILVSSRSEISSFFYRFKMNGKNCHVKLGRTTEINLDQARQMAKQLKAKITRQRIMAFHTRLKTEGLAAATCNHYVKLLKHSLNLAVEWDLLTTNPATKIPLFHENNQVENYLEPEQLERLLTVLQQDKNRTVCQIILWQLAMGSRLGEGLKTKWEDIDRKHRVWRIPASNSKNRRVRSVPLNDSAISILDQLDTEGEFEWLFVNRQTGQHFVTIQKVWERLRKKAQLPFLRIHDLRHNHASIMVNSGRTLYEVQQVLGHMNPKVTQRYSHLSTKTMQEASDCVSRVLDGAMKGEGA